MATRVLLAVTAAIIFLIAMVSADGSPAHVVGGQGGTFWQDCGDFPCESVQSVACPAGPPATPCVATNRNRCQGQNNGQCQNQWIDPPGPDNNYQFEPCQPSTPVPGNCKEPFQRCKP